MIGGLLDRYAGPLVRPQVLDDQFGERVNDRGVELGACAAAQLGDGLGDGALGGMGPGGGHGDKGVADGYDARAQGNLSATSSVATGCGAAA
jgi:hypothetical protein